MWREAVLGGAPGGWGLPSSGQHESSATTTALYAGGLGSPQDTVRGVRTLCIENKLKTNGSTKGRCRVRTQQPGGRR